MSHRVGNESEGEGETVFNRLDHEDAERVVIGGIHGDDSLARLGATVAEIRDSSAAEVPPALAAAHIAAAADAARGALGAERVAHPRERRRAGVLSAAAAKTLVGVALGLTLLVGASVAGFLPRPLQSVVANAAEVVGIKLPQPRTMPPVADSSSTTAATTTEGSTVVTSTTSAPSTTTTSTDDGDDGTRGGESLAALVGTHDWDGTGCSGVALSLRYEVTSSGTLRLISASDPDAESDTSNDKIEVEFTDGVTVRIDLERRGDDWQIDERVEPDCDDDDSGSSDDSDDSDDDPDDDSDSLGTGSSGSGEDD